MTDISAKLAARALRKQKREAKRKELEAGKPKREKKKKSPSTSKLEKLRWAAFSLYIRARDKIRYGVCFFCRINPIECAMHLISRGKRSIKYDERNVLGGCHSCNFKDSRVRGFHDKMVSAYCRVFGVEQYHHLVDMANDILQESKQDIIEWTEHWNKKRLEINGNQKA